MKDFKYFIASLIFLCLSMILWIIFQNNNAAAILFVATLFYGTASISTLYDVVHESEETIKKSTEARYIPRFDESRIVYVLDILDRYETAIKEIDNDAPNIEQTQIIINQNNGNSYEFKIRRINSDQEINELIKC